jgi:hypothetical protein
MKPKYKLGDKVWAIRPCSGGYELIDDLCTVDTSQHRFTPATSQYPSGVTFTYDLIRRVSGDREFWFRYMPESYIFSSLEAAQAECARRNKEGGHLK